MRCVIALACAGVVAGVFDAGPVDAACDRLSLQFFDEVRELKLFIEPGGAQAT
jgi:hypothetical protein